MRVLFLAHSFPRSPGDAAGSFVLRLASALVERGAAVEALVPHAPGLARSESLDGVSVRRYRYAPDRLETLAYTGTMAEQVRARFAAKLALGGLVTAGTAAALARVRVVRPDVVHAHWWFPAGLAGAAVHRVRGLPLVTTSHGSDVRLARTIPGGPALLRAVVRQSARLTAVSSWLVTEIGRLAPSARVTVAPMPVDDVLFTPGAHPTRRRLLFVGRLNEQKGLEVLLRALACGRAPVPLDVVGDGPRAAELRSLAVQLGVGERVSWQGTQPPARLAVLYRDALALVVPSVDEGLGLVAVEAQLSGTAVIAFASGGLTDVVRDGHTGLLVHAGDAAALAAAIDRLASDPALACALGDAARVESVGRFSPGAVADTYLGIYRDAIGRTAA